MNEILKTVITVKEYRNKEHKIAYEVGVKKQKALYNLNRLLKKLESEKPLDLAQAQKKQQIMQDYQNSINTIDQVRTKKGLALLNEYKPYFDEIDKRTGSHCDNCNAFVKQIWFRWNDEQTVCVDLCTDCYELTSD